MIFVRIRKVLNETQKVTKKATYEREMLVEGPQVRKAIPAELEAKGKVRLKPQSLTYLCYQQQMCPSKLFHE